MVSNVSATAEHDVRYRTVPGMCGSATELLICDGSVGMPGAGLSGSVVSAEDD